jgi:hypothetical protein
MGWFSYAQPAAVPRSGLSPGPETISLVSTGTPVRPELADLGRSGRRLVRRFVAAARADEAPTLPRLLADHFGPDVGALPVVSESWPPYEHVNVQLGLDAWLEGAGRTHELIGMTGYQHMMFGLADLARPATAMHGPFIGSVALANLPSGPGGATHACVQCGLYLVREGERSYAVLLRGSDRRGAQQSVMVEVLATDPAAAADVLAEVRRQAVERNVFRGQVLSFGAEMFGPEQSLLTFHERPTLERSGLVLPAGLLEAVEQQVIGVARHRARLRASGQHLKRGLLLHGPPGTGKTHTVRYLLSRLPAVTVVMLSGNALGAIAPACSIARALAPSLVVVEDVDLIAEDRGMHPGHNPLLFQLLNEMDGLGEDVDVTFVLTTNRADLLEPALAARPGRVDSAIEFRLPDADARRRLLALYKGGLRLDLSSDTDVVDRTDGVTASFLKELLRKSALVAADEEPDGDGPLTVTDAHLAAALDALLDERNQLTRMLLGARAADPERGPSTAWLSADGG